MKVKERSILLFINSLLKENKDGYYLTLEDLGRIYNRLKVDTLFSILEGGEAYDEEGSPNSKERNIKVSM